MPKKTKRRGGGGKKKPASGRGKGSAAKSKTAGAGKKPRQTSGGGGGAKTKRRPPRTARAGPAKTAKKTLVAAPRRGGRMVTKGDPAFAGLKGRDGCAALVQVAECAAGKWDRRRGGAEILSFGTGGARRTGGGAGSKKKTVRDAEPLARALAAVGHRQRIRIAVKLLEGPATYRSLQHATGLKPGPLYHHIQQLRLAGLILPKRRDLYELTRGGRNLIVTVLAVAPLILDRRARPQPVGD